MLQRRRRRLTLPALAALALAGGCATLQQLVQAPRFSPAAGHSPELRLLAPSRANPLGGAGVRLWARVENPNPVGVNLSRLTGSLYLEDARAGDVDLPLGLPLRAQADTVVPLDLTVGFANLPEIARVAQRLLTASAVPYRLDGRFTVDAGALGPLEFGPETLLRGEVAVRR
ncbi:MAG: LEA type 2 family protein [Gemmatimonadetes bacterium]|nr:LEA type 2 family protein [Gemmatimonadota bacterium]